MKISLRGLFFIVILINMSYGIFALSSQHCLIAEPKIKLEITLQPSATCFDVYSYFDCEMGDKTYIVIYNVNCTQKLFYTSEDGQISEIIKNYPFRDTKIPQEIGAEWTRQLYFEDNPNDSVIIYGKNIANISSNIHKNNSEKSYLVYYLSGALIVILIIIYIIFRRKK